MSTVGVSKLIPDSIKYSSSSSSTAAVLRRSMLREEYAKPRLVIWVLLAAFSCLCCYVLITFCTSIPAWLLQQLGAADALNDIGEWIAKRIERSQFLQAVVTSLVVSLFWLVPFAYVYLIIELSLLRETKRSLKLGPLGKCFFESMFVLACLGATYLVKDFYVMLLVLVMCFHIIPVVNLLAANENFGFVDCFLALLIEASLYFCREYPKYAPLVVATAFVISAASKLVTQLGNYNATCQLERHSDEKNTYDMLPL